MLSIFNIRSCVRLQTFKKTVDKQEKEIQGYEKLLKELVPSTPLSPLPHNEKFSNETTIGNGN